MPNLKTSASFSVSEEIAKRAGLYGLRYMTEEGRVLLSESDMRRIRLEPDEYVHGMDAIEVTGDEAKALIAANGYRKLPDEEAQDAPEEEIEGESSMVENEEPEDEVTSEPEPEPEPEPDEGGEGGKEEEETETDNSETIEEEE